MRRVARYFASVLLGAFAALAWTFAPVRLAPDPPDRWHFDALPEAHPPPTLTIARMTTGAVHSRQGLAVRGGSLATETEFAMAPILVDHPRGKLLIDSGFGRDVDDHFARARWLMRVLTRYTRTTPAVETLAARGVESNALRGIVLTHAHWDHVSGVADFPATPVLVPQSERDFIASGSEESALIRGFRDVKYEIYAFEGGEYLGFPAHHDFFGDGSVVAVPAPGHTPGSVVVFVTLPGDVRYAFIGDLSWTREGVEWPAERPWLPRSLADADAESARAQLRHLHALHEAFPALRIVPAHDVAALAQVPAL